MSGHERDQIGVDLRLRRDGPRPSSRLARAIISLLVVVGLLAFIPGGAAAAPPANDVGPERVYFPQTGHYLAYGFLDYWHHHGDIPVFGYPVTEEFTDPATGLTVQYFERAVFEWHGDAPSGWKVQLRRLGSNLTAGREGQGPFRPVTGTSDASCTFYPQTGHRLCNGFRDYWNANGGLAIFGYPISEEFVENGYTVQYFERQRFEYHPENPAAWRVLGGLLGSDAASRDGVNRASLAASANVPVYDPGLWTVPAPAPSPKPTPKPPAGAPSGNAKWIEVNLSTQYLQAWSYDQVVFGSYVSTGVAGHLTPTGTFSIYTKLRYDDMSGGTRGVDYYYLPDVPYVMYFYEAYALHGTYWHHNFGTPMSHGCVNLPTDAAGWLYGWAPIGTPVYVHY